MQWIKGAIRDRLPLRLQVPMKYAYGRLRRELEPEMALLPSLVRRGERAIDIGSNRGAYAYRFHQLGARVEVFEPNPVCLRVLRSWAQGKAAISVHAVALSATSGTAELAIPIDELGVEHDASGSIEHSAKTLVRIETVPIKTLDSYGFNDAVMIKIDVEGHEQSVISGALKTIAASRPALLIEIEQRHLSIPITSAFKRICELRYEGFFVLNSVLQPIVNFDIYRHQALVNFERRRNSYINNFLFLASDKIDAGSYNSVLHK